MPVSDPLLSACRYLDACLPQFAVGTAPDSLFASIKAVTELAHAADWLLRHPQAALRAIGTRWMDHAWTQIEGGESLRRLIISQPRMLPAAICFLPFHLAGRGCDALSQAIICQLPRAVLPPLGWTLLVPALRILGIPSEPAAQEQARILSVLENRPPPEGLAQDAVYLLAHECLYASHWGRRAPDYDAITSDYVEQALRSLVRKSQARGDVDVLAELLLAGCAVGQPPLAESSWQSLAQAQSESGRVQSAHPLDTRFPRLPHPALERSYHTTLVAIMAWAAARPRDPVEPPASPPE